MGSFTYRQRFNEEKTTNEYDSKSAFEIILRKIIIITFKEI